MGGGEREGVRDGEVFFIIMSLLSSAGHHLNNVLPPGGQKDMHTLSSSYLQP